MWHVTMWFDGSKKWISVGEKFSTVDEAWLRLQAWETMYPDMQFSVRWFKQ